MFSAFSALTLLVWRQEGHLARKNWVVVCWCGYLRCRLAYRWNHLDQGVVDASSISAFKGWLNKIRETRMGFLWTDPPSPRPPRWVFWLVRPHKVSNMAQLMPLPLTDSCFSKIDIGFTFLVPAHSGSHWKRAAKRGCVVSISCGRLQVWRNCCTVRELENLWFCGYQSILV